MRVVKVEENKNNIVAKTNALMKAKGHLSETSQKMLAMVISMIRADDTELTKYALKISDYTKMINSDSKNDQALKDKAEELMRNPFWIGKRLFNWCSMVDLESTPGYIVFDIHPFLKPHLLQLGKSLGFTQYKIVNILSLKGDYVPRLYELFKMEFEQYKAQYKARYNKIPKSYMFELDMEWLREFMLIPDSYRYNDIKRNIIKKAEKQLEAKTDIKFSWQEIKLGRKVTGLHISIKSNDKGSSDWLSTRKAFIDHVREKYKPTPEDNIFPIVVSTNQGDLKLDKDGKLYMVANKKDLGIVDYDSMQSNKLWDWLYEQVKENKIILKERNE
jgi:plasmid replication initiation protein